MIFRLQKYIFILLTVIFCITSLMSCNEFKINDLDRFKLKGKLQTIQEISYQAIEKDGKILAGKRAKPSWKKDTKRSFNRKGDLIEELVYSTNGNVRLKSKFKANFKEKSITEKGFDAKGNELYIQISKLNDQDEIYESIRYDLNNTILAKYEYQYNETGNLVGELQFLNDDDKASVKTQYKYDEFGNKIEEYMYNPLGNLIAKWISSYNEENLLIEEKYYYADGSLSAVENYTYKMDDHGNWIEQIVKSNGKPIYIIQREIKYY